MGGSGIPFESRSAGSELEVVGRLDEEQPDSTDVGGCVVVYGGGQADVLERLPVFRYVGLSCFRRQETFVTVGQEPLAGTVPIDKDNPMEHRDSAVAHRIAQAAGTCMGSPLPHLICRPSSNLTCVVAGATMPPVLGLSDW